MDEINYTNVARRLKARRDELGYSLQTLADKTMMSKSTLQRYETGAIKNIPIARLKTLSAALDIEPNELIGITRSGLRPATDKDFEAAGAVPYKPTHRIPILGTISAGLPLYAEEHIEGYTYTELNGNSEYFALRVQGDSMNTRKIDDGDIVVIRRQDIVDNGDIAVVLVNGDDATIKQFFRNGRTVTLVPHSTNPKHNAQIYDCKETDIRVLGKLVRNVIDY